MATEMTEEEIKRFAEQLRKPEGELGVQVGLRMNEGNAPMNLHTLAAVYVQPNDVILEIGMGNGFFVKYIVNIHHSIRYTGCDYSELMVQEAMKINKEYILNGQAAFLQSDASNLPFPNHSFNKIFTVNTLYFWEKPELTLAEFRRVIAKDGELTISVRPKHNLEKYPVVKYGFEMRTKEEIIQLLTNNGFAVTEITEIHEPPQEIFGQTIERETVIVKSKPQN